MRVVLLIRIVLRFGQQNCNIGHEYKQLYFSLAII